MTEYKKSVERELATIRQAMEQFPWGAGVEDIIRATANLGLERRTLQRRLAFLVKSGDIELKGSKRSAKYHLYRRNFETNTVAEPIVAIAGNKIPLSAASQEILKLLSIPIRERKAVSYNRAFADQYRPDVDFYLNE